MYPVEHIWTILMLKILQAHLLPAFVANSKIDAIYALYLESFCDKILLSGKFSLFLTLTVLRMMGKVIRMMTRVMVIILMKEEMALVSVFTDVWSIGTPSSRASWSPSLLQNISHYPHFLNSSHRGTS